MLIIGHVDFYLNGGQYQADYCTLPSCSHRRAYEFLIDVYKNEKKCLSKTNYYPDKVSTSRSSKTSPEFGDLFGTIYTHGDFYITESDCN